jgi:hypothetical protein
MKFNFKKVSSVLASAAMLGSTIGIAAAAAYPGAFTGGGGNDVAIVVGQTSAPSDFSAALDVGANLNAAITASTVTGGEVTTSGETYALFSGSSPLYMNASINGVRDTLTKSQLPTVLADQTFEGIVSADVTQNLKIGNDPIIVFSQQPSGDDDPQVGISLASTCGAGCKYIYNATIDFDQTVDFTNASSKGEDITLFGQKFTVASATTATKLVLLKSSETLDLSVGGSNPNPSQTVTIDGKTYTIELTAATDNSATVRVTDSNGKSDSKEVNEAASKKIQGLEVSVNTADESTATNTLTAEVIVGASKVVLQDGTAVKIGADEDIIEGTFVEFGGNKNDNTINLTKIEIQVTADESDNDAITPGQSFVDPVFGSFKVDFAGLNIGNDDTSREKIMVKNSGGEKMSVQFTTHEGDDTGSFIFAYNKSDAQGVGDGPDAAGASPGNLNAAFDNPMDLARDNTKRIIVSEMARVNRSDYVVLGNEDDGGMFQVTGITNATSGYSDDEITLKNVFSQETQTFAATSEGVVTATLLGRSYTVNYFGANSLGSDAKYIRINHPDSTTNDMVLFPTIQTEKGAKVMFYEPTIVNLTGWDGDSSVGGKNVSNFKIPNGNGYTTLAVGYNTAGSTGSPQNVTIGGSGNVNTSAAIGANSVTGAVGQLTFNFSSAGIGNTISVKLRDDTDNNNLDRPAIVIIAEKDDATTSVYEALIVELDAGYDGDSTGLGVAEVTRTWGDDANQNRPDGTASGFDNEIQLESDTDLYQEMDFWGSIVTLDKSDSDQTTAEISYPDDQVFAQVYISAADATVSTGTGGGNIVPVYDNEAAKISGKNLIVVGGSCVNTIAAELLGSSAPLCGADFTASTTVGSGEYLIETFSRSGKMATLVAGYNAADTTAAANALTTQKPDIAVGMKYKGDSSGTFAKV